MSAPAGWHEQPDGRERYWDGTRWTDEFRSPAPRAGDDQTQAFDVSSTQAMPQQPVPYGQPAGYSQPGAYGPPPQRSGNGWLKGCLIALAVVVVLAIAAVVAAVVFFGRAVNEVSQGVSSSLPSGLPTTLPSNLPSDLPSGLPTQGLGARVDITVGRGFDIPRARVEDGWSLRKQGVGSLAVTSVDGMKATLTDGNGIPVLFTLSLPPSGGGEPVQTVCTAPAGSSGATVDVSCVPLLGDVADARQGTVTTTL